PRSTSAEPGPHPDPYLTTLPAGCRPDREQMEELSVSTRKRLSDILSNADAAVNLRQLWSSTEAAAELAPVPPGEYICRCLSGELFSSKNRTPGYKLTLQIAEGEYAGRHLWHDFWLSAAALAMSKRDLAKIGVVE